MMEIRRNSEYFKSDNLFTANASYFSKELHVERFLLVQIISFAYRDRRGQYLRVKHVKFGAIVIISS